MHEKAKIMQGYGRPGKISTGCVDESCVMEESRRPMERTLDAWMPRRPGVVVKNKFRDSCRWAPWMTTRRKTSPR